MGNNTRVKDFRVQVKAAGESDGLKAGQVRMLVSVFGNVDSYGDVVMPGAFTESLAEWSAKGDPIPFIWSHQWSNPFAHIGVVDDAKETDAGLDALATLDVAGDEPENEFSRKVYQLLKERRVTQASFAYDVLDAEWVEREAEDGGKYEVYELRRLGLLEVGPTLIGANRETELLAAKSRQLGDKAGGTERPNLKAGRVLSAKNFDTLKGAHEAIGSVLDSAGEDESGKADRMGVDPVKSAGDSEAVDGDVAQARARLLLIEH
ncbi:HK97 family phage prohead protease [Rhodococcus sp. NPDC019627]|uniref:HK97 family phage prohead protease n=1 Tax=unclassified Rhodococcus (in: high G+C Gram-positive bacteria) TaxID=192944 RepID=UPI0037902CC1